MLAAAGTLAALTALGRINPYGILALTFVLGCGTALMNPAWQAIQPELVPREQIPAAATLGGVNMNLARAVGPALGGLVVALAGAAAVFAINAASFPVGGRADAPSSAGRPPLRVQRTPYPPGAGPRAAVPAHCTGTSTRTEPNPEATWRRSWLSPGTSTCGSTGADSPAPTEQPKTRHGPWRIPIIPSRCATAFRHGRGSAVDAVPSC